MEDGTEEVREKMMNEDESLSGSFYRYSNIIIRIHPFRA